MNIQVVSATREISVDTEQGEVTEGWGRSWKSVKEQEKCEPDLEPGEHLDEQRGKEELY